MVLANFAQCFPSCPNGPFRALRWYPKGPRVGQLALLACIIHVRSVLGPFEPSRASSGVPVNFSQWEGAQVQKNYFACGENFLMEFFSQVNIKV